MLDKGFGLTKDDKNPKQLKSVDIVKFCDKILTRKR